MQLKAGIEIHQQLATGKLFCSCPAELRDDPPHGRITRRLRAVSGELGEIDTAALQEMQKDRCFIYEYYDDTTCLVEMDDEPPHEINKAALEVALQLALILKMQVVDRVQIMRKIVIDGSNTSGFQRTALIARNGVLKTGSDDVKIDTLCLEEESARIIEQKHDAVVYRLDRLGIPLIEIATAPDLKSPEQVKDVALAIGMLLRSTGKVKRGIGTIRQDVNISIPGGERVEIKGAQDLRLIPEMVGIEVRRQGQIQSLTGRFKGCSFDKPRNLSKKLAESESILIQKTIASGGVIQGMRLGLGTGLLGTELQPNRRVGTDLSEYAKVRTGIGGLMHGDELPAYGISAVDVEHITKALHCKKGDNFVIFIGELDKVGRAALAVQERWTLLSSGIPKEVRKANPDGTTSYLRPIPSAARMYPETDIPPVIPNLKGIVIPEGLEEKARRLQKEYSVSGNLASLIIEEGLPIEDLVRKYPKVPPTTLIGLLIEVPKEIRSRFNLDVDPFEYADMLFPLLEAGKLTREAVFEVLLAFAQGKSPNPEDYFVLSDHALESLLRQIIKENPGVPLNAMVGKAMAQLRGKADGKEIVSRIKSLMV